MGTDEEREEDYRIAMKQEEDEWIEGRAAMGNGEDAPHVPWHQALSEPCWCGQHHDPTDAFHLNRSPGLRTSAAPMGSETRLRLWLVTINDAPLRCGFCAAKIIGSGTGTVHEFLEAVERHAQTCERGISGSGEAADIGGYPQPHNE